MELSKQGKTQEKAGLGADMSVKTARKYLKQRQLPSRMKQSRRYRTRHDPFAEVWPRIVELLTVSSELEAKTIFEYLQNEYPGRFENGQLRTLQRHMRQWRATEGPPKEVFFEQVYRPGEWCAADFTNMNGLGITIQGQSFAHMLFHFVLPYSNWQTGSICFSESFEALIQGLQNALWQLGGVPGKIRTDRLTAAVFNLKGHAGFQKRYLELLTHYRLEGQKTNPYSGHENGDVEQSHNRFKRMLHQRLLLRGHRDFNSRQEYEAYLAEIFVKMNQNCQTRFREDATRLNRLPDRRIEDFQTFRLKVGPSSTIRVAHTTYSVHSRLIRERIDVRLFGERLEVWYAQKKVDEIPRQKATDGHFIQYRHIIDWLVRKPGAFQNYRYRADLFPTTNFRIAYDRLCAAHTDRKAEREYLRLLHLAAHESEDRVNAILAVLLGRDSEISSAAVLDLMDTKESVYEVTVEEVNLNHYDDLLSDREEVA